MKKCFKCGETRHITEFYTHNEMADGYLNKCKLCAKTDATNYRNINIEKIREYDRKRKTKHNSKWFVAYRIEYPNRYKASYIIKNERRRGRLFTKPCSDCGSTFHVHAHHDDYLEPLNIRWLCAACHRQWHRDNGPGLNP